MDFIVHKNVTVPRNYPMVVIQKRANVDVKQVIMVMDVKQVKRKRQSSLVSSSISFAACLQGQWGEDCSNQCDCNGNTCNSQTGQCDCPAGRSGLRCEQGKRSTIDKTRKDVLL